MSVTLLNMTLWHDPVPPGIWMGHHDTDMIKNHIVDVEELIAYLIDDAERAARQRCVHCIGDFVNIDNTSLQYP
jgi:hypothetical protein